MPNLRNRILRSLDPEVAKSFTEEQLRELERSLAEPASSGTPINIRLTMPMLWRQFYITFLAGPERRSKKRLNKERARHPLLTFANTCCFIFLLLFLVPAFIGLVHIITVAR